MAERDEGHDRLLSLALHEFRTPLNVAAGYLKMLADPRSGSLSGRQAELAGRAGASLEVLARLLADLAEIGRLDEGEAPLATRRHDLGALAAAVVEAAARQPGTPRLVLDTEPGSYPAHVDVERLERALRACLEAVARAAQGDSPLVVSVARRDPVTAAITVAPGSLHAGPTEGVSWGPADEWRGGLGLELPLARRVIEGHGGRLLSPSEPDRRPAFRVLLPLATPDAAPA